MVKGNEVALKDFQSEELFFAFIFVSVDNNLMCVYFNILILTDSARSLCVTS